MRALMIAGGVFFGLPALAGIGAQLYAAITVANVAYEIDKSIAEVEEMNKPPVGKYDVENVKADEKLWSGYGALADIGKPDRDRVVSFDAYVRIRDLLQPGEPAPDRDFADVFVSARANAFADAECGRLLSTLASECAVTNVNTYRSNNDDGIYTIQASLAFVQKDEFGTVKEKARLAYREVSKNLSDGKGAVTVMPSDAARQRQKFYKEAARVCGKLRKSEGNCAIYRIRISTNDKSGSDAVEMRGEAEFSFLQPLKS